jgi:hypothetical protein
LGERRTPRRINDSDAEGISNSRILRLGARTIAVVADIIETFGGNIRSDQGNDPSQHEQYAVKALDSTLNGTPAHKRFEFEHDARDRRHHP